MATIEPNAFVTLDYTLRDEGGEILDASEGEGGSDPIEYVHGFGMLVPGLEAALAGMNEGDDKDVVVPASEGYGEYDDELILEIDRTDFPDPAKVKEGDEFVAESPDGDELPMEVIEVKDDVVVVDANHPLAGVTLFYRVKIRSVRPATADELERAAAERGHLHDESCDHGENGQEEGPAGGLIQIKTKH